MPRGGVHRVRPSVHSGVLHASVGTISEANGERGGCPATWKHTCAQGCLPGHHRAGLNPCCSGTREPAQLWGGVRGGWCAIPTGTAHTHRLSRSSCVSPGVPRDRRLCSKEVTAGEGAGVRGSQGSTRRSLLGRAAHPPLPEDVGAEARSDPAPPGARIPRLQAHHPHSISHTPAGPRPAFSPDSLGPGPRPGWGSGALQNCLQEACLGLGRGLPSSPGQHSLTW